MENDDIYTQPVRRWIQKEKENLLIQNEIANYKGKRLYEWQAKALELLKQQKHNEILWIIDEAGGTGTTWLCNYIKYTKNGPYSKEGDGKHYAWHKLHYITFEMHKEIKARVQYKKFIQFKLGGDRAKKYMQKWQPLEENNKIMVTSGFEPNSKYLRIMDITIMYIDKNANDEITWQVIKKRKVMPLSKEQLEIRKLTKILKESKSNENTSQGSNQSQANSETKQKLKSKSRMTGKKRSLSKFLETEVVDASNNMNDNDNTQL